MSKIDKFIGICRWVVARGWVLRTGGHTWWVQKTFYSDENALELYIMTTSQLCEYTITTNFTLFKGVNLYYVNCISKLSESKSLPFKGGWDKVNSSKINLYYRQFQSLDVFLLVNKQLLGELSGCLPRCYLESVW